MNTINTDSPSSLGYLGKPRKGTPRDEYGTPDWLYQALNEEFQFWLDAAASEANAKCACFFDKAKDALQQQWTVPTFCNPPYSQAAGGLLTWVIKGYQESQAHKVPVVMVVPGDTSTGYREFALSRASEIRDLTHRVRFDGATGAPPFPTAIYVFRPVQRRIIGQANVSLWDLREGRSGTKRD